MVRSEGRAPAPAPHDRRVGVTVSELVMDRPVQRGQVQK